MEPKEMFKKVGKGMVTRRAASLLAHNKDYKSYINSKKDFSPAEREQIKKGAERIGDIIRRKDGTAAVRKAGVQALAREANHGKG